MASNKYKKIRSASPDSLGTTLTQYTMADADLPVDVKCVFFTVDCDVVVKNIDSATMYTIPYVKGLTLPFIPGRILSATNSAICYLVA